MAKQTALIEVDHSVPKNSRLAKSELELRVAMMDEFEAWYRQGVILERIKRDKEFQDAGYTNFDVYVTDRRPVGISKSMAWEYMQSTPLRHLLPDMSGTDQVWTPRRMRALRHKDFTKADVKRIGKKIATQVKNGEPLTESLVKRICDEDRGIPKKKAKKKAAEIAATDTPAQAIERMTIEVNLWLDSLGKVPNGFWSEALEDEPGCVKELISSLSEFAKFLRS